MPDRVVDSNHEGSASNKSSPSGSHSRPCLIHECGDLDMPLAVAQLGHVQLHALDPRTPAAAAVAIIPVLGRPAD